MSPRRGLFVTFEGIEGSGKSTQLQMAAEALKRRGVASLSTREPGGTAFGRDLRRILLESSLTIDPAAELLLMFADRRQHLTEEILPALSNGAVVLCDRYTDASRAYQGAGRGLTVGLVDELHARFCVVYPRRTYLFDCPLDVAFRRVAQRAPGSKADRFESQELAFHRRVRSAYRAMARKEPKRFVVFDATRSPKALHTELMDDLESLLAERKGRAS